MAATFEYVKVYTVRIQKNAAGSGKWYQKRIDDDFTCVLVCKKIRTRFAPFFLVLDRLDHASFRMPASVLVIDPIHTYIVYEELFNDEALKNIQSNYSTKES